jgi:putative glutamine amidotransferase
MSAEVGDRRSPTIVITLAAPAMTDDPATAVRKNSRYHEAIVRAGGTPSGIDQYATNAERKAAFAAMDGLLLSGGADIDPARYGRETTRAIDIQPGRDQLEAEAWAAANERSLPILGICRGLQAINVFSGGTLIQHIDGHESPSYGMGPVICHPVRVRPGTRLATILGGVRPGAVTLTVNSYHHQAVRPADLANGLIAAGGAPHPGGDLVEALESGDPDRFLIGVQCHPERTESTPEEFERLFAAFVEAASGGCSGMGARSTS